MVVNIVDVGWATSKSGCLPITGNTGSKFTEKNSVDKFGIRTVFDKNSYLNQGYDGR
jgi:hypothetical protein